MIASPYFTYAQAAAFYQFPSTEACRKWIARKDVPVDYRGRSVIVLKASMDEALERERQRRAKQRRAQRVLKAVS